MPPTNSTLFGTEHNQPPNGTMPQIPSAYTIERIHGMRELAEVRRGLFLTLCALVARKQKEEEDRAAVQAWSETLEREIRTYRRWRRKQYIRWVFRIALFTLLLFLLVKGQVGVGLWLWFFISSGAVVDAAAGSRHKAADVLARACDPRAVGVLALAARDGDRYTREVATRGLKSILPALKASDVEHITPEGKEALLSLLQKSLDPDLLIAALKALEQIGDQLDIPLVQLLTRWKRPRIDRQFHLLPTGPVVLWFMNPSDTWDDSEGRVREAACHCLATLQERSEQERLRNTLLRPAQAPQDPASILLRPVDGTPSSPPNVLLRPADTEGENGF